MNTLDLLMILAALALLYFAIGLHWHRDAAPEKAWGPHADQPVDFTPTERGWSCSR